jgi:hypothetical protein
MGKTLLLRKAGSHFVETTTTEGKHAAIRSYDRWEKVEMRLSQLGFQTEQIALVKSELDSGEDTTSFLIL